MTTRRDQFAGLAGRLKGWIAARRQREEAFDAIIALDRLNEHLSRDAGLHRLRSAGPRRYDPWM
jgi:uncharacterized protein YjiS (DUF1127 family)